MISRAGNKRAPHTPAAKISPPVLKLKVMEQRIVVHVEPPKLHIHKMHSSLQYKIYLTHPSGEEVHTHTHNA